MRLVRSVDAAVAAAGCMRASSASTASSMASVWRLRESALRLYKVVARMHRMTPVATRARSEMNTTTPKSSGVWSSPGVGSAAAALPAASSRAASSCARDSRFLLDMLATMAKAFSRTSCCAAPVGASGMLSIRFSSKEAGAHRPLSKTACMYAAMPCAAAAEYRGAAVDRLGGTPTMPCTADRLHRAVAQSCRVAGETESTSTCTNAR